MSDARLPHMTNIKELVETGPIASDQARRAGGRAARLGKAQASGPAGVLRRKAPPRQLLGADGAARLHEEAMRILAETGVEMRHAEALDLWRKAGAGVENSRVRIAPQLLQKLLASLPSEFTLAGGLPVGGDATLFAPMLGARHVIGLDGLRRQATRDDLAQFQSLAADAPMLDLMGANIVSADAGEAVAQALKLSAKPIAGSFRNEAEARAALAAIAGREGRVLLSAITSRAPLLWEEGPLAALITLARAGQPAIVTAAALAGATSPASVPATLALVHAGALAGLALTQLASEGSAHVHGHHVQAIDMRSGAPMGGTAEAALMTIGFGELARHAKLAFRANGAVSASKAADAQAGLEASLLMQAAIDAGAHVVAHAAGMLEAGEVISYAKFMLDCDQIGQWRRYGQAITLDGLEAALKVIREVGPEAHYLGTAHTLANFRQAFHVPELLDFGPAEQWEAEGSRPADIRANEQAGYRLAALKKP